MSANVKDVRLDVMQVAQIFKAGRRECSASTALDRQ